MFTEKEEKTGWRDLEKQNFGNQNNTSKYVCIKLC